jgi:peptidyl-tRNA hydrolase
MHPKQPDLLPAHYETIVHNIGRLVADEITSLNKFNLANEIPLLMEKIVKDSIKLIVKKQNKITNKSTVSMAKKKQPKEDLVRKHNAPLPKKKK